MEITKNNYFKLENEIIADIEKANFISFDLELTGINNYNRSFIESAEERYRKYKNSAEKYRIIQLGIVAWFKSSPTQFVAKPYNIYTFPQEDSGNVYINCDLEGMIFNKKHGMDFNKWIKDGVGYMNSRQESKFKERINEIFGVSNINLYDPEDKNRRKEVRIRKKEELDLYKKFYGEFKAFVEDKERTEMKYRKVQKVFLYKLMNGVSEEIRDKIYIVMPDLNEENKAEMKILKVSGIENKLKLIEENRQKEYTKLYEEFKKMSLSHFGGIFDTKFIYSRQSKNEINLEKLYEKLYNSFGKKMNIQTPEGFNDYYKVISEEENEINENKITSNSKSTKNNGDYHQADYDAFVTGCCFIFLLHNLLNINDFNDPKLDEYKFKINITKSHLSCFDLRKEEELIVKNTEIICLKSSAPNSNSNIFLPNYIPDINLQNMVKETSGLEGYNTLILFVDNTDKNKLNYFFNSLNKNNSKNELIVCDIKTLRKIVEIEEKERKGKNKQ